MLSNNQLKFLKKSAHRLKPIFQVGKNGVNPNMLEALDYTLENQELIKISVLDNCPDDKKEVAFDIARGINAHVVQVIGNTIVMYRESRDKKKIELPRN